MKPPCPSPQQRPSWPLSRISNVNVPGFKHTVCSYVLCFSYSGEWDATTFPLPFRNSHHVSVGLESVVRVIFQRCLRSGHSVFTTPGSAVERDTWYASKIVERECIGFGFFIFFNERRVALFTREM